MYREPDPIKYDEDYLNQIYSLRLSFYKPSCLRNISKGIRFFDQRSYIKESRMRINKWIFKLTPIAVMIGMFSPGSASAGCSSEPYIGSMCVTAASYCPSSYYMQADGALLYIDDYTALFSLLGTNFGGDGRVNFKLPDMRGRTAVGVGTGPSLSLIQLGEMGGHESINLTEDNLPAHTHNVGNGVVMNVSNANVDVAVEIPLFADRGTSNQVPASGETFLHTVGKDNMSANEDAKIYGNGDSAQGANLVGTGAGKLQFNQNNFMTGKVDSTGKDEKFTNRQPYVGLTHCIAVFGLYPPRP